MSRNRTFRVKRDDLDRNEEDRAEDKAKSVSKPSLLSFDQDGDDANRHQIREKRKARLRLPDSLVPLHSTNAASTQQSAAGEYNQERLRDMQNNTLRYIITSQAQPKVNESDMEGIIDEEEEEDIPEMVIREAREKRERLRTNLRTNQSADFIPLDSSHSQRPLAHGSSRNMDTIKLTGTESDSEDPDDHIRIKFSDKLKRFDASIHSKTLDEDEEDQEDSFGAKQLQKAILRSKATISLPHSDQQQSDLFPSSEAARIEAIENAAEVAMSLLRQGVERAALASQATQSNIDRSSVSLSTCNEKIARLKEDLNVKGQHYVQYQQIRSYVADLCDCFADKIILIEALETSLNDLRVEVRESWVQDEEKEAQLYARMEATVSAILIAMSTGQDEAYVRAAANSVDSDEVIMEKNSDTIDEFGRSLALEKRNEAAKGKILQNLILTAENDLAESIYRGGSFDMTDCGGWIDDNKSLAARRSEILETIPTVFADAGDEFSSLQGLKSKLEAFKIDFPHEYQSTYFAASSAALFSPFVRLELLSWEPIFDIEAQGIVSRLDMQRWHQELFNYGLVEGTNAASDQDNDLVPQLVRKLVLPTALVAAESYWNILSVNQSQRVAELYEDILVYCEHDEANQMLQTIQKRIEKAVSELKIPLWPSAVTKHSTNTETVQFRCFRRTCLLIKSLGYFDYLLPQSWLRQLALTRLVVQQCLPYLRAALSNGTRDPYQLAAARLEMVASSLHDSWLPKDASLPELKPLFDHVQALIATAKRGQGLSPRLNEVARKLKLH